MISISKIRKSRTLSAQIRATERRVLNRQRQVGIHTAVITQQLKRQISTPPNLLLAGGIGFILGELTQKAPVITSKNGTTTATTPLKVAFNLFSSLQTVYAFLPLVLMAITAFESKTPPATPADKPR